MSKTGHTSTSSASSQDLYPVVQDLTEAEYGSTGLFCGGMLGSFALEDLILPNASARSMSPTASNSRSVSSNNRKKRHPRGHSLLQLPSMARNAATNVVNHKRSNSAPNSVEISPTVETSPTESSRDDGVNDHVSFDDVFVLTRQVRNMRGRG